MAKKVQLKILVHLYFVLERLEKKKSCTSATAAKNESGALQSAIFIQDSIRCSL